jgi:hypothetical protein
LSQVTLKQTPEGQNEEGHDGGKRRLARDGQEHKEERRRSESEDTPSLSHDPLAAHVRHLDFRQPARRCRAQL